MKLYVHSLVDKLKWFYENARCYNKIYESRILRRIEVTDSVFESRWRSLSSQSRHECKHVQATRVFGIIYRLLHSENTPYFRAWYLFRYWTQIENCKTKFLDPLIWAHLYPWTTTLVLSSVHILTKNTDDRSIARLQNVVFDGWTKWNLTSMCHLSNTPT